MSYTYFKGNFMSTNKIDRVNYYICEPESEIRAIIQFAHGWVDCFDRNRGLIDYFTEHGIMVCGCDFIGHDFSDHHGKTDFKKKNGWAYLVKDLQKLNHYIRRLYPDLPIYLYGHGLGSLVARMTVTHNEKYAGLILSGTSGRQHFCRRAMFLSRLLKLLKGSEYKNRMIELMMQQKVNHRFLREHDEKSWECSDPDNRKANNMGAKGDEFYTMSALRDMFFMLSAVSSASWYEKLPGDMPILLISGQDDPIGGYGRGIREIEKKLKKAGIPVEAHLYPGMRHNLQDEPGREQVFDQVLRWMKSYLDE